MSRRYYYKNNSKNYNILEYRIKCIFNTFIAGIFKGKEIDKIYSTKGYDSSKRIGVIFKDGIDSGCYRESLFLSKFKK